MNPIIPFASNVFMPLFHMILNQSGFPVSLEIPISGIRYGGRTRIAITAEGF